MKMTPEEIAAARRLRSGHTPELIGSYAWTTNRRFSPSSATTG